MIDNKGACQIKIPSWKYSEIEREVVKLYSKHSIHSYPIDPFAIIKNEGYVLIPFSKIDFSKQFINKNSDAFSFYSPQLDTYVIVYNDNRLLRRIRFTLMHEIGHIKMGHKGESDLAKKMADYYAGYALAPFPLINLLPSNSICDISSAFSVSSECASISYTGFQNWKQYGEKRLKDYEVRLINLFK